VGRREGPVLEDQRHDRGGQDDEPDRRRHVEHQHHAQAVRHGVAHAGGIIRAAWRPSAGTTAVAMETPKIPMGRYISRNA